MGAISDIATSELQPTPPGSSRLGATWADAGGEERELLVAFPRIPIELIARDAYIDRIRVILTAMVIFHHSAVTYGASGGWFYREFPVSSELSSLLLTFFCATNQAFFMGFFFLLAGYYTPRSLDKKGYACYLADRFLRLGLPLLAFGFVLSPITIWLVERRKGVSFGNVAQYLWRHRQFENGPLWFAQALIIFALLYACWHWLRGGVQTSVPKPVPSNRAWLVSALLIGAAALAIRQFVPVGVNVIGLQVGYFASYIFLFGVGIAAARNGWLDSLKLAQARRWMMITALTIPLLPAMIVAARVYHLNYGNFVGGFSLTSVMYALWEPFVAFGIIAGMLVWFRENGNRPSPARSWFARRAYTVFIIHPPVLVTISMLLLPWHGPALAKFAAAGSLAVVASWMLAGPLVLVPGVRRIV